MVQIIFGSVVYFASLIGCYDGDTCTVRLMKAPEIVAEVTFRFEGFDTPEIRGKCDREKFLAKNARQITLDYMLQKGVVYTNGKKGKYGRLLVTASELELELISAGVARPYDGGKRGSWCQ